MISWFSIVGTTAPLGGFTNSQTSSTSGGGAFGFTTNVLFNNATGTTESGSTINIPSSGPEHTSSSSVSFSLNPGTVFNQTTQEATITTNYTSTESSSFSLSFITTTSVGTIPTTTSSFETYSNVKSYVTSIDTTYTEITNFTSPGSSATASVIVFMPEAGEVIWYYTGTDPTTLPISELQSAISQISTTVYSTGFLESQVDNYPNINFVLDYTTSFQLDGISQSIDGEITRYVSNFSLGGFSSFTGTEGKDIISNSFGFTTAYDSTESTTGFFGALTYVIASTSFVSSSFVTALESSLGTIGQHSSYFGGYGTASGSTFSVITFNTTTYFDFSSTFINSTGTVSQIGVIPIGYQLGSSAQQIISPNPTVYVRFPNIGFRLTPTGNLASQIGLGGTLSMAPDQGSFIFAAFTNGFGNGQTVPVQYPNIRTWKDSNSISYGAAWKSISLSVTGSTSHSTTIGTTPTTTLSTSSSSFIWTSVGAVTQTFFNVVEGQQIFIGSGSYYTDLTGRPTVVLNPGCYASSNGTTSLSESISFTLSTADFIRALATISLVPGPLVFNYPVTADQRSLFI